MKEETLYPYRIDNHFVYVDLNKSIILSKKYDMAYPFVGDYAIVTCKAKQGVINKKGNWILKPKYENIQIKSIGPIQVFLTYDYFDTNYEIHRWRLIPNVNIFSQRGPLVATSVSYTKWRVFDETGKILLKRMKPDRYDDYNNHGNYYAKTNHAYSFYYKDEQLFIHDTDRERVYTYKSSRKKSLRLHRQYKNVVILIDKGYLFFKTDRKEAFLADFNHKPISKEPFLFIRNLITDPSTQEYAPISNQSLWKHESTYLCSLSFGDALIPVPQDIVSKANLLIYPLDRCGNQFWLNMGGQNMGIISKSGEWVLTSEDISFHWIYGDLTVLYKQKSDNRFFSYKEGIRYTFPIDTYPDERIEGQIWKLKVDSELNLGLYAIYDAKNEVYQMKPMKSIYHLIGDFYSTIIEDGTNKPLYAIINKEGEPISDKRYESIRHLSKNDDIVCVKEQKSDAVFYVVIRSGEELRTVMKES